LKDAIYREVRREPFAQALKRELVELEAGFSAVEMDDPAVEPRERGKVTRTGVVLWAFAAKLNLWFVAGTQLGAIMKT
jgi:hypothetical protein